VPHRGRLDTILAVSLTADDDEHRIRSYADTITEEATRWADDASRHQSSSADQDRSASNAASPFGRVAPMAGPAGAVSRRRRPRPPEPLFRRGRR
jgi:hypothetical protein